MHPIIGCNIGFINQKPAFALQFRFLAKEKIRPMRVAATDFQALDQNEFFQLHKADALL
jgi:hypothetical protein